MSIYLKFKRRTSVYVDHIHRRHVCQYKIIDLLFFLYVIKKQTTLGCISQTPIPPKKKINGWGWRWGGGGQGMSERTFCLQTVGELMPIFCKCTMFQIMSNEYQQVIQSLLRIKTPFLRIND